jgi:hypothetical protein
VNAAELVNVVTRLGGRVTLEAGKLKARVPADRPDLLETLKANRDAVLEHLANTGTEYPESQDTGISSPVIPGSLEHLATAEQDRSSTGPDLLPAQSPWLELSDNAQAIWDALEAQGTRTINLIDQDGRKACHCFTASKPSDLRELATRGLKTFPNIRTLTVIAVMPEFAIWQLEPRAIN